ncbi:uncharacterized protein LOC141647109 [Silene latifolia]|uniref:uncharacterized protein LOC141647109 n=1 Tax=Silene latifolia TaxID=37657 RepID=UPI003D770FFF
MAKGDDVKAKKKNKAIRKKLNRDPAAAVSARVAAIIAAKKRRHTGKRRQCQGMCFSLPTPEDPFNDRRGKEDTTGKKFKKGLPLSYNKGSVENGTDKELVSDQENLGNQKGKKSKHMELVNVKMGKGNRKIDAVPKDWEGLSSGDMGCPSKFLFNCLNSIWDFLVGDGEIKGKEKSLIADSWGLEFWRSYSLGRDMLENSGTNPSLQQIAWIASTAADSFQRKESELISLNSPFLLYLVPSQEKAVKVRSVCKPLKLFGIHTVSLHTGSSVEHQVSGLKSCDPEFVVATPERLWELVTLNAIDISDVALLVVDALDSLSDCINIVKCIKDKISGNSRTVVFRGLCSDLSTHAAQLQSILKEPVDVLLLGDTSD